MNQIKAGAVVLTSLNTGLGSSVGLSTVKEAYNKVPLIFRAIRLRCDTLTRVPCYVYPAQGKGKENAKEQYYFEESLPLHDLIWKNEAAYLLNGASYTLKNRNKYGVKKGLQWLNPFTVQYDYINGEYRYWQQLDTGERYPESGGFWDIEDFLYFNDFNPDDDLGPGISPTQVALGDARTVANVTKFLGNFFAGDATPTTLVIAPTGTAPEELTRIGNWFRDKFAAFRRGRSPERVLPVTGDVKIEQLTHELSTLAFDKVDTHSLQGISDAFGIPQSLLRSDSGANRAISDNDRESFLNDTIIPRCQYFERVINPFLKEFNQRIEFAPEELPEMQVDEAARASSLKTLTDAGVPLKAALDMLGYDLSEDAEAEIEKALKEKEANKKKLEDKLNQQPENGQQPPPNGQQDPMNQDMQKWQRKAMKALAKGKPAQVTFDSEVIPEDLKQKVYAALEAATSEEAIKSVFNHGENHA
jgi:HK97 family phage portal protein